ncbi:polysaccharide biosynthesis C-terminal domain-containing protein [Lyngbya confervoides]|uniref:NAD-dependent epimerase/dehydratase family protein n=1 Tax=Lyngbya confervoides BDU141951 TaxID=1574623 RepID=A0ABD4T2X0_9CYAN|nr:NAD-dependent epimerase/dehydratase family protein [Lyngbya confervoides]MCM1983004.1 NAD-dependent epimerase/dehydratase family protein [Lyngbya confervoides BDU141951]
MPVILITGSKGFIGQNLNIALRRCSDVKVLTFDSNNTLDELDEFTESADLVFHLAGVNRPNDDADFIEGNVKLTQRLCESLSNKGKPTPLVLSSSTQAQLDNPYGRSKYQAERIVQNYNRDTGSPVYIYRLPNVFGKWSRPNYNSVVATFCHNITHDLPVTISNPANIIHFVYVGDIINSFLEIVERDRHESNRAFCEVEKIHSISLGNLHDLIMGFENSRFQGIVPDFSDLLTKYLYSVYVSHRNANNCAYPVELKTDNRGWLFELIKSPQSGQIFVSSTRPGVTRGNHYHDSKVEKFCVIKGDAIVRLRSLLGGDVVEYPVNGTAIQIIDIPPGYTHSIENIGNTELLTLFWANEIFDPLCPDTWSENVLP